MSLAPRTHVKVLYAGVDITRDISKDLISLEYTDNEGGTSDDISIKLKNNHGLWSGDWLPTEGDAIECTIITENDRGVKSLNCGRCEIDELQFSGPPSMLDIKGVSVPINNTVRRKKKSRAWENVRLSEIAADVAKNGELELLFQPNPTGAEFKNADPLFDRRDQREETDLQFLQRLCKDEGFTVKVTANQLVVYDTTIMATQPATATYELGKDWVLSWDLKSQAHDVYKTAIVEYNDPTTGKVNQYTYSDPSIQAGQETKIVKRASSIEEAERIAKAAIKSRNRTKVSGTLTVVGSTALVSGITIQMVGFGKFDGKYYVSQSVHSVGSGYTVRLEIQKVES